MQTDCRVITAELDQLASSSFVAYRHDHGRMATLANDGLVRVFTPGDSEQQWDLLCQTNLKDGKPIQVCLAARLHSPVPVMWRAASKASLACALRSCKAKNGPKLKLKALSAP